PVSATSLPLPTGASTEATLAEIGADIDAIEANVDVALSTRLKAADTLTGVTTVAAVTAISNPLPAGTNRLGSIRPVDSADADLTSAKGSQTGRFLGNQAAKDAGRSQIMLSWEEMAGTAAAESTLTNFTLGSKAAAG